MPDKHVFEGGDVLCNVVLPDDLAGKPIKFVFTKGGNPVGDPVDAVATRGFGLGPPGKDGKRTTGMATTAKGTWKAAKCEGDANFYKANYHLVLPGNKKKEGFVDDIYVYRKTITIEAKKADGKPYPDAILEIEQPDPPADWSGKGLEKTDVERRTNEAGKLVVDLPYPEAVTFMWKAPFALKDDAWTTDKGPKHEATLVFNPKLKMTSPVVDPDHPKGYGTQWVNLSDVDPAHGSRLDVVVEPVAPAGVGADQDVYLKAEFDGGNSDRMASSGGFKKGTVHKTSMKLGPSKKATFPLELGKAGGNKVTISIGSTADCADAKLTVETWRKIYYEIMAPDFMQTRGTYKLVQRQLGDGSTGWDLGDECRALIKEKMDAVFVKYECWKSHPFAETDVPTGSVYDGKYVKQTVGTKYYILGGQLQTTMPTGKSFSAKAPEINIKVRLCDVCADNFPASDHWFEANAVTSDFPVGGQIYKIEMNTGGNAVTDLEWLAVTGTGAALDDTTVLPSGSTALAVAHPGRGQSGPLTYANIDWLAGDHETLKFNLAGTPAAAFVGALSDTKCPVQISFKLQKADPYEGSALNTQQLMKITKPWKAVGRVVCHEVGHAMGMTVKVFGVFGNKPPHGLSFPPLVPEGDVYGRLSSGHTGGHCAHGLTTTQKKLPSYQVWVPDNPSNPGGSGHAMAGDCLMFGADGDDANVVRNFCDVCKTYIKARNLANISVSYAAPRTDEDC